VDATETDPNTGDNTDAENTTVNNALGCTITGTAAKPSTAPLVPT
jgi:hypothetical protein